MNSKPQIKAFVTHDINEVEREINSFLNYNSVELIDIKYSTAECEEYWTASAIVIYREVLETTPLIDPKVLNDYMCRKDNPECDLK